MRENDGLSVQCEVNQRPRRLWLTVLRSVLGVALLGTVTAWAMHEGRMLEKIGPGVVLLSFIAGIATMIVNALSLRSIAGAFGSRLSALQALRVASLGSLGNALGGLPIGTALKYAILFRNKVLTIGQFTAGLAAFSAAISLWLLGYAAVSVWGTALSADLKPLPAVALGTAVAALVGAGYATRRAVLFRSHVLPFLSLTRLADVFRLSGVTSFLFIANYWIIARTLLPEMSLVEIVFVSSAGILIGLGSLFQSMGGVQELSMGLVMLGTGHEVVSGIECALLLRLTSVLASAVLFALASFAGRGEASR